MKNDTEYNRKQSNAIKMVKIALKSGKLVMASSCELCGKSANYSQLCTNRSRATKTQYIKYIGIVGHHYAGYDEENALKLWWLCKSCNYKLSGPQFHNGSINKEEAIEIIKHKMINPPRWPKR